MFDFKTFYIDVLMLCIRTLMIMLLKKFDSKFLKAAWRELWSLLIYEQTQSKRICYFLFPKNPYLQTIFWLQLLC